MTGSTDTPPLSVRMMRPAAALAPFLDAYYIVETFSPLSDLVLPGPGNIRFSPSGEWIRKVNGVVEPTADRAALFGPTDQTSSFESTGAGVMLGAGLSPLGWAQLIDTDASALANRVGELGAYIGHGEAEAIADAVDAASDDAGIAAALDGWLSARVAARPPADPRVAAVHRALLGNPDSVTAFADTAGITQRTLHRLCLRAFGFAPKGLLRQKRFLRTLERVRGVLDKPLAGLIDDGYYDQAHFNRDFRYFLGMSPTAYYNLPREIMRRSAEERRDATGRGLQGLHDPKAV